VVKNKKAIFFDRDGTLIKTNRSIDNKPLAIKSINEIKIYPSVKKILENLTSKYLIFIITNQPDVEKKKNTKKNVIEINNYLKKKLPIKKIYTCFCTNKKCRYRKPNPGMMLDASRKYKIDLKKSFVVGDRWKDIDAGHNAKCKTIYIDKKYNEKLKKKSTFTISYFSEISNIFKL
jgi:D-glycero-D-manno-heptose 1,7-bisphosphate phosphatase